jgi:hypothetical protein
MRAVVAQLDRATGYELVGWGFESLRPRIARKAARNGAAVSYANLAGPERVLLEYGVEATENRRLRLGSSAVEQGTHKPLVGCSNHPRVKFERTGSERSRFDPR